MQFVRQAAQLRQAEHAQTNQRDVGHRAHRHRQPQVLALQAHAQHMGVLWADGHDQGDAEHHAGGESGKAQNHEKSPEGRLRMGWSVRQTGI